MFPNPWVDKTIFYAIRYINIKISSVLVFTISFGTHYNFFIVLPIRLQICRSNDFSFLQGKICIQEKSGASQVLRARARPIGIGAVIRPGLSTYTKLPEKSHFSPPSTRTPCYVRVSRDLIFERFFAFVVLNTLSLAKLNFAEHLKHSSPCK